MTSHDLQAFSEMFRELASMFRLYGNEDQKAATLSAYFETLQTYPLERVRQGYEQLKTTATKWPVPAQWIAAMPKAPGADLLVMSHSQARDSDEAERLFYEGQPCPCADCVVAHVSHMPVRFVPCLDANGETISMRHPRTQKPTLLGEWIHGHRLKRWYGAKAEFYQKLASLNPGVKAIVETEQV